MLKRLIEVALPLKEVSEQSAREKAIRHGHISTLHIWWARRPLAACRAVVFASLIPDPDDPECPASFRSQVNELLDGNEFKPKNGDGSPGSDTARNRCLEYIKHLVKWENSNTQHYLEPARKLIAAAHKLLHPDAQAESPKVLDPFAGGGAIPLEALRLGCEAHAIDLNPVAHLIELCTLSYPQKYGKPNSRPVPDYIKRLIAHNKAKRKTKGHEQADLFGGDDALSCSDEIIPDVEITEAEYLKNPLAADVKYWGHWVLEKTRQEIGTFYPPDADGSVPVAYLWARTVKCPNPVCGATIPLIRQLWLCKKAKRKVAIRLVPDTKAKRCRFEVAEGKQINFDPNKGTMQKGSAECPFCQMIVDGKALRTESKAGRMGQQLMAVVTAKPNQNGKNYRPGLPVDEVAYDRANQALVAAKAKYGSKIVPDEPMTPDRPSPNSRGLSGVVRYGMDTFGSLFNPRQALALATFARSIAEAGARISTDHDEYGQAVQLILALNLDRLADLANTLCRFEPVAQCPRQLFARQAVAMVWDYAEGVPTSGYTCSWEQCLDRTFPGFSKVFGIPNSATVTRGTATALPFQSGELAAVVSDPPYYDSVPYSDLSDFFYVWLKRTLGTVFPDLFRTPLTPKAQELIAYYGPGKRKVQKPPEWYEKGMQDAFVEMCRVLNQESVACIMFAHKTTSAWEAVIAGLLRSGLVVSSSWPFHTEMKTRMVARNAAALASSVTLVCRKRPEGAGDGLWDDVRQELRPVAKERLDFFWSQGIRGADFFISAIGPALGVFGKYERVKKLSGAEITVGQFLDEVRGLVTAYALNKIMKTTHTATIDAQSQFYVIWKWSYGEAKVPADEAFKLAQALGMVTETMWDRTGVLEKSGENVQAVGIAKRMKVRNLGEPTSDTTPASLIDVLHRLCVFRDKNDTEGMTEFLGRSGQGRNPNLWLLAQAVSEILPDGDKEKQLMQGLLNQRDQLEEAGRQLKLF
jgi:adenine-specific DNA methylase